MSVTVYRRASGTSIRWVLAICLIVAHLRAGLASAGLAVEDIVGRVSQASYTHYLENVLYTHLGDNRGFGPEHDLARDRIFAEMRRLGLKTSFHSFLWSGATFSNVVGAHYGISRPKDIYILGAHYDSADNPGADDDASGCAGLLEAARVLAQCKFEATLLFIAFDREEQGLAGSKAYVTDHRQDNILGMVSLDLIGCNYFGLNEVRICGDDNSHPLQEGLRNALLLWGKGLSYEDSGPWFDSDYLPFERAGFRACLLVPYPFSMPYRLYTDASHPYCHTPNDAVETPGNLDYPFATKIVRAATGFLATSAVLIPEAGVAFRPVVDFNGDGKVDVQDCLKLVSSWGQSDPALDIAPPPAGDGKVDEKDLEVLMGYWGQEVNDPTLVAHWRLDDATGTVAEDCAGAYDGIVHGEPVWQAGSGKIRGGLQFDGVDDYVSTRLAWDPTGGPFTVFAWVKGGSPGQVVISQKGALNWLSVDPDTGWLTTGLTDPPEPRDTSISQPAIADGQWHRVGLVCDGSRAAVRLYVDSVEVAKATSRTSRPRSSGGLQIGASKNLEPRTFWSGLIDDVRVYNRTVRP